MVRHRPRHKNQKSLAQNRDTVRIARRERHFGERRDFVPQDDFRRKLPSEEFFGPIERTVHDANGKPVNIVSRPILSRRDENGKTDFRVSPVRKVFEDLRNTVCRRRKERRQVLFAKRKTGKGGKKHKHLWNLLSDVICSKH